VGTYPNGVAVSPNGAKVYVTNGFSNTVSVIDAATNKVTSNIPVGPNPFGIVIASVGGPTAAFSASPTSGKAPLTVKFTDKSTNNPTSWSWKFGDGTTSTTQSPSHTYSKAGKYTVNLTVTNSAGSNTSTKSSYINVVATPVAAFSASPTSGKAPLTVKFTDKSTKSPTSWSWNFGDKSTSTAQSPSHKYTKKGTYSVSLTVKNTAGSNSITKSKYITVK
jgi:YVTN family beta-propeller protein